jgi:hypothetical protein
MLRVAEFLELLCTALFTGAAVYVNLAEHPARMGRATRVALEVWAPSYALATRMQAPLAVVGFLAGCVAFWLGRGAVWLIAAVLLGAVVPFTFVAIMPTNRALLDPARDPDSPETRALLRRWGWLHGVRSVLSLAALLLLCWYATRP